MITGDFGPLRFWLVLNNWMNQPKSKISENLISFIPVRRADWVFKASVYKDKYVMLVCINSRSGEFQARHFTNQTEAVDYIEMLVNKN